MANWIMFTRENVHANNLKAKVKVELMEEGRSKEGKSREIIHFTQESQEIQSKEETDI